MTPANPVRTWCPDLTLPAAQLELPPLPRSVREARTFLRSCVASWETTPGPRTPTIEELPADALSAQLDVAVLLLSELVTNVVLHARTSCVVGASLQAAPARLVVWVEDSVPALPLRRGYSSTSGTGRGIMLVGDLSSDWGVDASTAGKAVWFSLLLQDADPDPSALAPAVLEFDLDAVEAL